MEEKNAHLRKRASIYVHFGFCICAFTEAKMHIYGRKNAHIQKRGVESCRKESATFWLPYMRIYGRKKCAFTEAKMCIYGRELPYMRILVSINAHIQKEKCAYMEAKMHIYGRKNAHIRKRASVYAHFGFCKYAYTEAKMRIYGSFLP
jgi:hypothetical protein